MCRHHKPRLISNPVDNQVQQQSSQRLMRSIHHGWPTAVQHRIYSSITAEVVRRYFDTLLDSVPIDLYNELTNDHSLDAEFQHLHLCPSQHISCVTCIIMNFWREKIVRLLVSTMTWYCCHSKLKSYATEARQILKGPANCPRFQRNARLSQLDNITAYMNVNDHRRRPNTRRHVRTVGYISIQYMFMQIETVG